MTMLTSLQNPQVKDVVRMRKRSHREGDLLLVEGYREIRRALDNGYHPTTVYYCRAYFLGGNEEQLLEDAGSAAARLTACSREVFAKMAYRDRPDGLLALVPWKPRGLNELELSENPLLLIAESIEKPGNLGTMLRSADATGADAVIICDRRTDLGNPNVIRAGIGTLFAVQTVEAETLETMAWLKAHRIFSVAATPFGDEHYTSPDLSRPCALVVGAEQYGLSDSWLRGADHQVAIPMLGQCDSLNVATAAAILLYEAIRQRGDDAHADG